MLQYNVPHTEQTIVVSATVVDYLLSHRQTKKRQPEAGGQLFARITPLEIYIDEATGPRKTDKRSRYAYTPDRKAEQNEIRERFRNGRIYVGDWHTHPSPHPSPSITDTLSIMNCFAKSVHKLNAFLLVIVGSAPDPTTWFVSLSTHNTLDQLIPSKMDSITSLISGKKKHRKK